MSMQECTHIHVTGEGTSQVCEDCDMQMTRSKIPVIPEHPCKHPQHAAKHDTAVTAWDIGSRRYLCHYCISKDN